MLILVTAIIAIDREGGFNCHLGGDPILDLPGRDTPPLWSKDGNLIVSSRGWNGILVVDAEGSSMWSLPAGVEAGTPFAPGSYSPALSPDGSRVAYAVVEPDDPVPSKVDIAVSDLDGSGLLLLTDSDARDSHPAWSPDGTKIAFISNRSREPGFHLHVMDADGGNQRMLLSSINTTEESPLWSPDGRRIAFVARDPDRAYIVYTIEADGSRLAKLGAAASRPAWSPDGKRIAFIREGDSRRELHAMDADGRNRILLMSFEKVNLPSYRNESLSWSPDGSEILYGPHRGHRYPPVVIVRVDGSGSRVLFEEGWPWATALAAWSPDGSRIVFHDDDPGRESWVILYTTARDGSDVRVLVRRVEDGLVAESSDWNRVSGEIDACSSGSLVDDPQENVGLVRDCESLLLIRDQLAGDAFLNWSSVLPMAEWIGVTIDGSPRRVTVLDLAFISGVQLGHPLNGFISPDLSQLTGLRELLLTNNSLMGTFPQELGSLPNLRVLDLSGNLHMEGCVPTQLSTQLTDFSGHSLDYC